MPVIITLNPASAEITTINPNGKQSTQTIPVAATPDPAKHTLHQYNLPEANSLNPAVGLKELFPGLKLQAKREVDTQHPAELVSQYRPQPEQGDHLVIKSPGEEHPILKALAERGLLQTFNKLSVQIHEKPLYETAEPASRVVAWLAEQGFDCDGNNTEDPDWPVLQFKRNPLQNTVDDLRYQLQKAQADCQSEAEGSKALEQHLKETEQQLAETRKRLQHAEQKAKGNQDAAEKAKNEKKTTEDRLNETLQAEKQARQRLNAELETLKAELAQTKEKHQQCQKAFAQEQTAHNATKEALEAKNQQYQALEQHKSNLNAEKVELAARVEQAEQKAQANQDAVVKTEEEKRAIETRLNEALQAEKNERQRLAAELESLKQELEKTREQLASQTNTQNTLKTLQDRMEYLFGQNTLQLEQAANALGQHVSQTAETTAKELEAGIALQQLAPGAAINQSGLPKSAALELASQLNTRNYDLIIEMGSGTTTQFIAQTLKNSGRELAAPHSNQKELSHYVEASDDDLPKRILSFDHNRSRQKELSEKLNSAGLANYVSLQFTPLVPAQYNGKEQLFYDCGTRLQQIAHLFDSRQARILIVVNTDPTETGPEPGAALPAVLQYLAAHQLEVIAHVPAEPQLAGQWENLLNERGLEHTAPKPLGTGQVQHITVNP